MTGRLRNLNPLDASSVSRMWVNPHAVIAVVHPEGQYDDDVQALVVLNCRVLLVKHMTVEQVCQWIDYWIRQDGDAKDATDA